MGGRSGTGSLGGKFPASPDLMSYPDKNTDVDVSEESGFRLHLGMSLDIRSNMA